MTETVALKPTQHDLHTITGAEDIPKGITIGGFEPSNHPLIPRQTNPYIFRKDLLRDVRAFLDLPDRDGLWLTGPQAAGKTSCLEQLAARLNWPVVSYTFYATMALEDLLGSYVLVNGETTWRDGPLALCVRHGYIFIANELDSGTPEALNGINGLLEGAPLVLPSGEIIPPHANFRFAATANTAGSGDTTGQYVGTSVLNAAFLDRFRFVRVTYPTFEEESIIVSKAVPKLGATAVEAMIKVAQDCRKAFVGDNSSGYRLSVPFSTRSLLRWARLSVAYDKQSFYALDRAFAFRLEDAEREVVHRIAQAHGFQAKA